MSKLNQNQENTTQKTTKTKFSSSNYSSMDTVRTYLHEIGRIPLLNHEEEIVYGKQVQQMMQLLEFKAKLEEKLNKVATRLEWAEYVLLSEEALKQAIKQGQYAKQKMIEANLRLVVAIAKKYQKRNMEFLDLIQEGTLGLER
ncbi:MAG: RNA polymerase sigma factor, RpoD/SigA family, partial [Trichodesmium sp. MAG_R04]|nr:RNA polymerase sigma factor, RpoD/SigA family [Trichodesmium sp. MAG_R04]